MISSRCGALALALVAAAPAVTAEESRYQTWQGGAERTQDLVNELRKLVDEAEKARAADPLFLQDLRALAAKFDIPERRLILFDDFRDGDYAAHPSWLILAGRFSVDPNYGLRSTVSLPRASGSGSEELAAVLLQTLLSQGTSGSSGAAAIRTAAEIANAFDVTLEFGSLVAGGRIAFGPHLAGDTNSGYRLMYQSGAAPSIDLIAVKGRDQRVIVSRSLASALEDRKRHTLTWTRSLGGEMTVALDGKDILRASDRSQRDAFMGFVITNLGGDFVVRQVSLYSLP